MNCNDIDQMLMKGRVLSPLPLEAEDHLAGCERCRELVEALNRQVPEVAPPPSMLRQIERGLLSDLRPVQAIPPKRYFAALLVGIFVCVLAVGVYRIGAFALAVMSPVQAGVILGALAISTGLLAYSLVNQMVPGSRHWIPPGFLQLGIIVALALAIAVLFTFQHERNFWKNNWACIRAGTSIGALATIPLWLVMSRGAILFPRMTGAATGLFAGLVGTMALEIHCPNMDAWHILVAHLGVAVLGMMVGFVFGLAAESGKIISRRP
jgi:hypothetical protein